MRQLFSQRGFGLIQVLFAISIIGVVLYLSLDNQMVSKKIKKSADFNTQVAEASEHISSLLSDPYICSASVEGVKIGTITSGLTLSGGARIGKAIGGDIGFTQFRNAIFNDVWNRTPRPPGTRFYTPGPGNPHLAKGTEFRPGIVVTDMRVLNDEVRDFIRITFEPRDTLKSSKMGAQTINKDFYITGEKNVAKDEFLECNTLDLDASLREVCLSQKGEWDGVDKKCLLKDLIANPADKIPVWMHEGGVLKPTPSYDRMVGGVSCKCDDKQCGRVSGPCTCALPSCDTRYPSCVGNRCTLGPSQIYNECRLELPFGAGCVDHICIYARPCGISLPPDGHVIKMQ